MSWQFGTGGVALLILTACDPSPPKPEADPPAPTPPASLVPSPAAPAPPSVGEPESAQPDDPALDPLPVLGEASIEAVVAALAARPQLEETAVNESFSGYQLQLVNGDHPNAFYRVREGEQVILTLHRREGKLGSVSLEAPLKVAGSSIGQPFAGVLAREDSRCKHEPGATCSIICRLPSSWAFRTPLRVCPDLDFEPVSKEHAGALAGKGDIEAIDWEREPS